MHELRLVPDHPLQLRKWKSESVNCAKLTDGNSEFGRHDMGPNSAPRASDNAHSKHFGQVFSKDQAHIVICHNMQLNAVILLDPLRTRTT